MEMQWIGFLDSKDKMIKYYTIHADLVPLNISPILVKMQSPHSYHQNLCHISGQIH
jgi:hypothetical protein